MALTVAADLRVTTPAGDLQILGRGSTVWVRMDSARVARHVVRTLAPDRMRRERLLAWLSRGLARAQLELRIVVAGQLVGRIGPAAAPNRVARWIGWSPARIRPYHLVRALLSRPERPSSPEAA